MIYVCTRRRSRGVRWLIRPGSCALRDEDPGGGDESEDGDGRVDEEGPGAGRAIGGVGGWTGARWGWGRDEGFAAEVAFGGVAEAEDELAEGEGGAVAEIDGVGAELGAVEAGAVLGAEVADGDAFPGAVDFGVGAGQVLVEDDPGGLVAAADD